MTNGNGNFKSPSGVQLLADGFSPSGAAAAAQQQIAFHVGEAHLVQNDPYLSSLLIVQPRLARNKQALVAAIRSLVNNAVSHLSLSDSVTLR